MTTLGIDPGPKESAYAILSDEGAVGKILPNAALLHRFQAGMTADTIAIEWVESFGMPVGRDVFETVAWIGRFEEVIHLRTDTYPRRVPRRAVKLMLCNSMRAKDAHVRQALLDRFPATGGGSTPQIGTKSDPGPLYGFRSHMWAALAVAVTAREDLDTRRREGVQ